MEGIYGVEELKKAVTIAIRLGQSITEALEDEKITFLEGASIGIGAGMDAIKVVKNAKQIWNEIQDLQESELAEIRAHVAEKFDIPNDKLEETITETLIFILNIANFGAKMGTIWSKK